MSVVEGPERFPYAITPRTIAHRKFVSTPEQIPFALPMHRTTAPACSHNERKENATELRVVCRYDARALRRGLWKHRLPNVTGRRKF